MKMYDMREIVGQFKVGEPLKSTFHPQFSVTIWNYEPGTPKYTVFLELHISAPDALGKLTGKIDVGLVKSLNCQTTKEVVHEMMRSMLQELFLHEIDESISCCGERIYDPHRKKT